MNLRIAHLTDLHITDGPRLPDQRKVLEHVVREMVSLGVQATLLPGDLYGRHVPHESTPAERSALYPAVRTMAKLGPVVVVPGNHDYPGDLDTLAELGGGFDWPVVVANRAQVLKLKTPGPDLHVYAVPWPTKRMLLQGESGVPKAPEQSRQLAGQKLDQVLQLWGSRVTRTRKRSPGTAHVLAAHCMTAGARTSGGEVLTGHEIELSRPSMESMGIDYGALGHLHYRQQVAERFWYAGSPWRTDFGEDDEKGWHLIDIAPTEAEMPPAPANAMDVVLHQPGAAGQHLVRVSWMPTPCRDFVTLDWRWAADEDGAPRWVTEPPAGYLASVRDAEVRARLVVPKQWVAGCPWDQVLQGLRDAGAHRIVPQRVIEPIHRVRAPEVAKASSPLDKLSAYWGTLASKPDAADAASAQALLADLMSSGDDVIQADTDQLLNQ
jgi:DNA repair exonuclease SbcCD nuclease subunit